MLNKDLLPSAEFLDSIHYGIVCADDPHKVIAGNLRKREAIALANQSTDETGIQFLAIDTLTGEVVNAS